MDLTTKQMSSWLCLCMLMAYCSSEFAVSHEEIESRQRPDTAGVSNLALLPQLNPRGRAASFVT